MNATGGAWRAMVKRVLSGTTATAAAPRHATPATEDPDLPEDQTMAAGGRAGGKAPEHDPTPQEPILRSAFPQRSTLQKPLILQKPSTLQKPLPHPSPSEDPFIQVPPTDSQSGSDGSGFVPEPDGDRDGWLGGTRSQAAHALAYAPDTGLTLGGLVLALWRRKIAIVSLTVLAGLVALAVLVSIRPQYEASARVLIEPAASAIPAEILGGNPSRERIVLDREAIASQVELIRSRDVALRVIEALDLTSRLEFASPGALESLLAIFGIAPDEATLLEQAVESYSDGLSVFHIPETRVIGVAFRSYDPELAAQVANAVAQGYLDEQVSDRSSAARATNDWLGDEIARLRERVAVAERRVQGFRAEAGLIRGANDTTLPAQRLSELNTQIAQARALRIDAEGRADQIRRIVEAGAGVGLVAAGTAGATPLMQSLLERQGETRARLADLSTTLGPAHPRIRQLAAQVADIASQVRAEARRLAAAFDEEARTAQAREETLAAELAGLQTEAADAEYQDVELRALEREAKAQRDLLETLLARFRETSTRQNPAAMPADARIISSASVPLEPAFPKVVPTLIAAMLGAFLLACGTTVANALVRQTAAPTVTARPAPARDGGSTASRAPHPASQTATRPSAPETDASPGEAATPATVPSRVADGFEPLLVEARVPAADDEAADTGTSARSGHLAELAAAFETAGTEAGTATMPRDGARDKERPDGATPTPPPPPDRPRDVRTALSLDEVAAMLATSGARPCILVVAPGAPVGAMTGLVLADTIALLGASTLCVDMCADVAGTRRAERLADIVGLPGAAGLGDLGPGTDYDDVLHAVPGSGAHVLLSGRTAPRLGEALDALALLHEAYDALVLVTDLDTLDDISQDRRALARLCAQATGTVLLSDGCAPEAVALDLNRLATVGLDDVTIVSAEAAVPSLKNAA